MKSPIFSSLLAVFLVTTPTAFSFHDDVTGDIVQTAKTFLASLDSQQAAKAKIPFADDERENWHFIPKARKGLPLKEMTPTQKHLAQALLSAGLSRRGYIKTTQIMSLEEILRQLEQGSGPVRDPEGYFFTVFGEPAEKGTWGYRVEGHHISHNFTLVGNKVVGAPQFLGANPAEVKEGPRRGLRVLAHEEDYARLLLDSMTPAQRKEAIVSDTAYNDILTAASRQAALSGQPSGLEASKLNAQQRHLLTALLNEYANNLAPELAEKRLAQIKQAGNHTYFAWAGGAAKKQPHYYRIQTSTFLIEYDNTQNNANHIHSVWRDFEGDFGRDLLKEHYQKSRDHSHN